MPKLILVLLAFFTIGGMTLRYRQEQLELRHRMATLHRDLQKAQTTLWRQQLDIATYTSPATLKNLTGAGLDHVDTTSAANVDAARE
ncbi:MAG: hypothetical protein QM770_19880 [Tepidisphaeraceae bacterium]